MDEPVLGPFLGQFGPEIEQKKGKLGKNCRAYMQYSDIVDACQYSPLSGLGYMRACCTIHFRASPFGKWGVTLVSGIQPSCKTWMSESLEVIAKRVTEAGYRAVDILRAHSPKLPWVPLPLGQESSI